MTVIANRKKPKARTMQEKDGWKLFWMAMPFILFIFVFHYLPLWGWSFAFVSYRPGRSLANSPFVGWENFTTLFMQPVMRNRLMEVLRNTLGMQLIGYLFTPLPMFFAVFLNEMNSTRYRKIVQTVTTLPNFISWVIIYALAYGMLAVDTGFINNMLKDMGLAGSASNGEKMLDSGTAKKLKELMRFAVQNDYGDDMFGGLTVCAKTGTGETLISEGSDKNDGWMVGFAADKDVPLAFACVVRGTSDYGYSTAGQVAKAAMIQAAESLRNQDDD